MMNWGNILSKYDKHHQIWGLARLSLMQINCQDEYWTKPLCNIDASHSFWML